MFSTSTVINTSSSQRLSTEQIDEPANPWYFYFNADKAKAKGGASDQIEFSINRKHLDTIWAENIAPPEDVFAGFKIKPKIFAKSLVESSRSTDPIVLYNTHNYDWIPYDGEFEVQTIKLTKNKLKIYTTAVLSAEDADLSLANDESIKLPNASFTFPVLDVDKKQFTKLHKEFEEKKRVKKQLNTAEAIFGPVTSSSPCVTLECDSCASDDDFEYWNGMGDRKPEITDDDLRSTACSLGRISDDIGPDGQPLDFIRGTMNSAFSGMYNCDCPCGCSIPGYCD